MANSLYSATRVNTNPTSDVLYARIEDVDCTGVSFSTPPEDGQFIAAPGKAGSNPFDNTFSGASIVGGDSPGGLDERGGCLAMVWSGGAQRADQQGLGYQRCPVVRGNVRFRTKLFNVVSTIAADYPLGKSVTVGQAASAVQSSDERLLLSPVVDGGTSAYWAVGFVTRIINDTNVAGQGELEIQLYDFPRLVNNI